MRVRMLRTAPGSPDGIRVELYKAGEVYDLPPRLSEIFISGGSAEEDKTLDGMIEVKDEAEFKDGDGGRTGKPGRKKRRKGK